MPDYSIIIPAYNEEDLLSSTIEALRLAMAQSHLAGEIIVVDNNSTDKTFLLAEELADKVIVEKHNQISKARNSGAHQSQSEFLIFVDADTIVTPSLLIKALNALSSGQACSGGCKVQLDDLIDNRTTRFVTRFWEFITRFWALAAGSFIFCRRDTFYDVGCFDEAVYAAEDVLISKQFKKWAKKHKSSFLVLDEAVITSSRKMQWFTWQQILGQCLAVAFMPWIIKKRRYLNLWYRRPEK